MQTIIVLTDETEERVQRLIGYLLRVKEWARTQDRDMLHAVAGECHVIGKALTAVADGVPTAE